MRPTSDSYLKTIILSACIISALPLKAQEFVTDTILYKNLLQSTDVQFELNYALMTDAETGDTTGIRWLMRHGAEIDAKTPQNVTPLMFAVANNQAAAVKVLLDYKPDLNVMTAYNETPLIAAVKNQDSEIAEMLIRDSADINLAEKRGVTSLHCAVLSGNFHLADMLIYYDALTDIKSNDGTTPLMVAVYSGFADIADLLLQNGANPEEKDNQGFTPLMIASQAGDTLIMDMLLRRSVNIYTVNRYNYDALNLSVKMNQTHAAEFLLRRGYKWNSSDSKAVNPYSVASAYNRVHFNRILKNYNIPETSKTGIDQLSFSVSGRFCFHDYYTGFSITAKEPKHNLGFFGGVDAKLGYTRVLMKENENLYYQYMDKGYLAYAGILKEFIISDNPLGAHWSAIVSLGSGYSFGNKFKGTVKTPDNRLKILPAAGIKWTKKSISVQANIEYVDTDFYRVGPIWLRTGFSYTLFFNTVRAPGKAIKWQ